MYFKVLREINSYIVRRILKDIMLYLSFCTTATYARHREYDTIKPVCIIGMQLTDEITENHM